MTERRKQAIELIQSWMNDEGEDGQAQLRDWPIVKAAIEENRLSYRRRFEDTEGDDDERSDP